MRFATWYLCSVLAKNRANRCAETWASAGSLYEPARAVSIAVSLMSVAKISNGTLAFASSRNSVRQMAIE